MKTIPHHAPTLGAEIVGLKGKDTGLAIFRGIPFASVTKRWTQSCMQNTLPSPFDATKFGPKCSQPLHESIVPVTLTNPDPGEDEFQCLNLNITVPEGAALPEGRSKQTPSLLPVMVWVHGYVPLLQFNLIIASFTAYVFNSL
jgi:carboxylesterase type B